MTNKFNFLTPKEIRHKFEVNPAVHIARWVGVVSENELLQVSSER